MAATIKCYGNAGAHIANKDVDWVADTIKLALVTSTYVPAQGTDEFWSTPQADEIAGSGGYTTGGFTLATKSRNYDSTTREEQFIAANVSVAALTPSAAFRYGIVYKDTGTAGTSILLAYINFGADQNPGGLPFAIQWASTGVFYIVAS